jgi:ribosome biogenesis ATPase
MCKKLRLSGDFNFEDLAKRTPGFVGADLQALTAAAGIIAVKRMINQLQQRSLLPPPQPHDMLLDEPTVLRPPHEEKPRPVSMLHAFIKEDQGHLTPEQMTDLSITQDDFIAAIPKVQPSAKREGFATVPDVTWDNVGALSQLREQLQIAIVQQIKEPEIYSSVGITAPSGVLLWGPPGCGKTLLAKAVANESRANFISVKGPELLNKVFWVLFVWRLMSSGLESLRNLYDRFFNVLGHQLHVSSSLTNSML